MWFKKVLHYLTILVVIFPVLEEDDNQNKEEKINRVIYLQNKKVFKEKSEKRFLL